jgi:RecB family exonuclease
VGSIFEQLAQIARDHRVTEKVLIAPSLAIGHQIGDRIAQSGTAWINLRVETIRTLADATASFAIAREGLTVLSRAQALSLVERACDRALGDSSYFSAIADRPGFHRAMQRSLDDLRFAGLSAVELKRGTFEETRKGSDLARILRAYEEELTAGRFTDRCGVLERAIELLGEGKRPAFDRDALWLVIEDPELSSREREFLALLAGRNAQAIAPDEGPTAAEIRFVRAMGEENEIRGVFRAVLSEQGSFDHTEIVYTDRDAYLPLIYELAEEHEVDATFAEGIPVAFTRPGAAALAFTSWIGGDYEAFHMERLFRAGQVEVRGHRGASSQSIARVVRDSAIGWGRDRYLSRLEAWRRGREAEKEKSDLSDARRAAVDRDVAAATAATEFFAEVLSLADEANVAASCAHFVRQAAAVKNEIDGMASSALQRMLQEIAALPSPDVPRPEMARRIREAVLALHVAGSNPRPGHIHVTPVRLGAWSGRKRLHVVGLDDSRHPGGTSQDPVLLDSERQSLNHEAAPRALPIVGERPQRNLAHFHQLLARAGEARITLSYSAVDLREGRERFPSSTLLQVYRLSNGDAASRYEELLGKIAGNTSAFVPAEAPLSLSEWWLAQAFRARRAVTPRVVERSYPWLAQGREAEEARQSEVFTPWDGMIEAPSEEIDPRRSSVVLSASRIERLANCPFRYFLEHVLRIQPLDALQRDPDVWLTPADFGSMLHEVLQTFMEEVCARGEKPSLAQHEGRIAEIAEEALQRWRDEIPAPNESSFQRQRDELLEACEVVLKTEERECGSLTARYFELPFGYGTDPLPEFSIPLRKGSVRVRGRIDRVDSDDVDPYWDVWDYKSGSTYRFERGGKLRGGQMVQHAIYARVIEELLRRRGEKGTVRSSGYYFVSRKGEGRRFAIATGPGELEQVLELLCDVAGSGTFLHAAPNDCRYCDFEAVCGAAAQQVAAKIENDPSRRGVAAWQKLRDIL